MNNILISRYLSSDKQTIGNFYVIDKNSSVLLDAVCLELPWLYNQRRISCIPTGEYRGVKHTSPTFGECIWIKDVPDRSEILIHAGNFHSDTLGCPLVGDDLRDINNDNYLDVVNSKKTLTEVLKLVSNNMKVIVK